MSSYERTGWRDESISKRHREWGFNCPTVDIDFLVAEYNIGKPVALIEYKHFNAQVPNLLQANYKALAALADGYSDHPLPFLIARYWPDVWAFRITPVNDASKLHFADNELLTEFEFVRRLYRLRSLVLTEHLMKCLHNDLPTQIGA